MRRAMLGVLLGLLCMAIGMRVPQWRPLSANGCGDAAYEPNENASQAYSIQLPWLSEAFICEAGDEDWFTFHLDSGQTIHAEMTSIPVDNDYDLFLYGPALGDPVAMSTNGGYADERLEHTAMDTGNYYVRVYGFRQTFSAQDSYQLSVYRSEQVTPTPSPTATATPTPTRTWVACGDVAYEPNDDCNQAHPLALPADIEALICYPDEEDWYAIDLAAGQLVHVEINSLPDDYDVYLYSNMCSELAQSRHGDREDDFFDYTVSSAGVYKVRVEGYKTAHDAQDTYHLIIYRQGDQTATPTATVTPTATQSLAPTLTATLTRTPHARLYMPLLLK